MIDMNSCFRGIKIGKNKKLAEFSHHERHLVTVSWNQIERQSNQRNLKDSVIYLKSVLNR